MSQLDREAEMLKAAMTSVDQAFNGNRKGKDKTVGIVIMTFPYGATDGQANYISNGADRRDMIALFRETAARFEGQANVKGHG